jgi:hypothetical protein
VVVEPTLYVCRALVDSASKVALFMTRPVDVAEYLERSQNGIEMREPALHSRDLFKHGSLSEDRNICDVFGTCQPLPATSDCVTPVRARDGHTS